MSDLAMITYAELVERLGGDEPTVPLFHRLADTLTCYVPSWCPVTRLYALQTQMVETWPGLRPVLVLVTAVPRDCLCSDWRAHAPEDLP